MQAAAPPAMFLVALVSELARVVSSILLHPVREQVAHCVHIHILSGADQSATHHVEANERATLQWTRIFFVHIERIGLGARDALAKTESKTN